MVAKYEHEGLAFDMLLTKMYRMSHSQLSILDHKFDFRPELHHKHLNPHVAKQSERVNNLQDLACISLSCHIQFMKVLRRDFVMEQSLVRIVILL